MSKTIPAGEFKAKCLKLMDRVAETGESIIITKRGKPVAEVVPVESSDPGPLFGRLKGSITYQGDLISPIDVVWNAEVE
ncbi:MAG: type II toxin-antitoxin system Phd/YefM family antitoxin [Gemmatimonadales bacterium]